MDYREGILKYTYVWLIKGVFFALVLVNQEQSDFKIFRLVVISKQFRRGGE
jgi:hypothetical protein